MYVFRPVLFCAALLLSVTCQAQWTTAPLVVHEWGVHEFDWSQPTVPASEAPVVPGFMYTDRTPGVLLPKEPARVKDLPPDTGIRRKPILYFYPATPNSYPVPVGVEVRFASGHASAWWPQVNVYRTPAQVAQAQPLDWTAWRRQHGTTRAPGEMSVPDDERFELCWHHLTLSKDAPAGLSLRRDAAADASWVDLARKVESAYVSNGKEADKFLFYEGQTHEQPAIALLPAVQLNASPRYNAQPHGSETNAYLVNASAFPLYDVFAVYRDTKRGVRWAGYLPELPALAQPQEGSSSDTSLRVIASLPLPDFSALPAGVAMDEATFARLTRERLLDTLTAGAPYRAGYVGLRDPADPQPPTQTSSLYSDEAAALERIWHDDFFATDGLTILYRESPAYLDQHMPLNLYTDIRHYIMLSRCGLVLNRHVDFQAIANVTTAIDMSRYGQTLTPEQQVQQDALLRPHHFLALGQLHFFLATSAMDVRQRTALTQMLQRLTGGTDTAPQAL